MAKSTVAMFTNPTSVWGAAAILNVDGGQSLRASHGLPWYRTGDYANMAALVAAAGAGPYRIIVNAHIHCTANLALGAGIVLQFEPNNDIEVDNGVTFTINSPSHICGGDRQKLWTLTGTGVVVFSKGGTVYPGWWGAVGDGAATETAALQAAITAIAPKGGILHIPTGIYRTGHLTLPDGLTILGEGPASYIGDGAQAWDYTHCTTLAYEGAGSEAIIHFTNTMLAGLRVEDILFTEWEAGMDVPGYVPEEGGGTHQVTGILLEPTTIGGQQKAIIENCVFLCLWRGVVLLGSHGADEWSVELTTIRQCMFTSCGTGVLLITDNCYHTVISECWFLADEGGNYGVYLLKGKVEINERTYFAGRGVGYVADVRCVSGYAVLKECYGESIYGCFFQWDAAAPMGQCVSVMDNCHLAHANNEIDIPSFADGGGGTVLVNTTGNHNLITGQWAYIYDSTHYDGLYAVTVTTPTQFRITAVWVDSHTGHVTDRFDALCLNDGQELDIKSCALWQRVGIHHANAFVHVFGGWGLGDASFVGSHSDHWSRIGGSSGDHQFHFRRPMALGNGGISAGQLDIYDDSDHSAYRQRITVGELHADRTITVPDVTGTAMVTATASHDYAGGAAAWNMTENEAAASYFVVSNSNGAADMVFPAAVAGKIFAVRNSTGFAVTVKVAALAGVAVATGKKVMFTMDAGGDVVKMTAEL